MRTLAAILLISFVAPAWSQPSSYDLLRFACEDDRDVARQIAGCEAVLDNPDERGNHPIALNNRGHARERSGNVAAALRDYELAVAMDPRYVQGQINRGRALVLLGRADQALAAFDRAIAIEDNGWARFERGRLLAARGDLGRALADLEEAVRRMPDDTEAVRERDRVRRVASSQPDARPAQSYVGAALLRAPLGPLPSGDALLAYTRELLAPALGTGTVGPGVSPTAFRAQAPGLPDVTVMWFERPSAGFAEIMMRVFERDLNSGCNDNRLVMQHGGEGARVHVYTTSCPTRDSGYRLWWLAALDRDSSRLLLLAVPLRDSHALLAAADRLLHAIGMPGVAPPPALATAPSGPDPGARLPTVVSPPTSAEAFASEYGERLVDDFTAILAESADRGCLASRGLAAPSRERAREWLVRYGERVIELNERALNAQAAAAAFVASAGQGAPAELMDLARRPAVQELLRLGAPMRTDEAADLVTESLDRHLLLARIVLVRRVSPLASGAAEPLELRDRRADAATAAVDSYLAQHPGDRELQRFMQLMEAWNTIRQNPLLRDPVIAVHHAFEGIIPELQAHCIGAR